MNTKMSNEILSVDNTNLTTQEMVNYIINSSNFHIPNHSFNTIEDWYKELYYSHNVSITKKDDFFTIPYDILKTIYLEECRFNESEGIIL